MYLVRSEDYTKRRIEVLAELEEDVIKVINKLVEEGRILESVEKVPDYQYAKEYLAEEKPEDLVYGDEKKGGKK